MVEVLYHTTTIFTREDHRIKELSLDRAGKRAPRRSQTHQLYQLPQPFTTIHTIQEKPRVVDGSLQLTGCHQEQPPKQPEADSQAPKKSSRPPLGPPRRSYSVTDREPIPHHHRPSSGLTLLDLPAELHFAIFDFLDPIDSTCLGLTNKHFYAIHRRMRGTVPLSIGREGPNELEWAWHLAGAVIKMPSSLELNPATASSTTNTLGDKKQTALSTLRVRGQGYCRKCGITRCSLHKHIQEWMGDGVEYCSVKQKFGPAAREGAKPYCYMSKPGDSRRCGRHHVRKTQVVLQ